MKKSRGECIAGPDRIHNDYSESRKALEGIFTEDRATLASEGNADSFHAIGRRPVSAEAFQGEFF
jgi:hypothetical protein